MTIYHTHGPGVATDTVSRRKESTFSRHWNGTTRMTIGNAASSFLVGAGSATIRGPSRPVLQVPLRYDSSGAVVVVLGSTRPTTVTCAIMLYYNMTNVPSNACSECLSHTLSYFAHNHITLNDSGKTKALKEDLVK